jgi:hypothetical protein
MPSLMRNDPITDAVIHDDLTRNFFMLVTHYHVRLLIFVMIKICDLIVVTIVIMIAVMIDFI